MKRPFPFHSNSVWPAPVLVGLFIVIYGLVSFCFWLIDRTVPENTMSVSDMPEVLGFRTFVVGLAAGVYALFRLIRFHPACNRPYAGWLKLSPWTADRPLPAGPVHVVWQDAAVVGVLTAIGAWHHVNPLVPVAVFILVYLAGFTWLLALTRRWIPCFILGFLWPSLILPGVPGMTLPMLCILAAIVSVIWYGHQQSLKAFPWDFIKVLQRYPQRPVLDTQIQVQGLGTPSAAGTQYELGWPYLVLSPKLRPPAVSQRTNLALGTLAGWWSFCLIKAFAIEPADIGSASGVILVFTILAAFVRLGIYASGISTPFNIFGRIATGRIVVPGFDKIFATPIAVVIAALIGTMIVRRSGAWYPVTQSLVIAIVWCVLFGGGPTLRNWALTGQVRLRPPAMVGNKQRIRQV